MSLLVCFSQQQFYGFTNTAIGNAALYSLSSGSGNVALEPAQEDMKLAQMRFMLIIKVAQIRQEIKQGFTLWNI